MKISLIICLIVFAIISNTTGLANKQDRFAHALIHGNLKTAEQLFKPKFSNLTIKQTNGQYSVPLQHAIVHGSKNMADTLLNNGAKKTIGGKTLAYYSAREGYESMAKHFVAKGFGSNMDISNARKDRHAYLARLKAQRERSAEISLRLLTAFLRMTMSGSSSPNPSYDSRHIDAVIASQSQQVGSNW